jgi:predicted RNA-binding protein YlqC (UPF0109 family)
MKDLIEYLAKGLVDDPEAVSIEQYRDRNANILHLYVAEGETGRVIGREGKIANAIRTLMDCAHEQDGRGRRQTILKIM